VKNNNDGFTLVASLIALIIFMIVGQMLLQTMQTQWQDLVFSHQRLQKENSEKSAYAWAQKYIQINGHCFDNITVDFSKPDKRGYRFDLSCRQEDAQFRLAIEREVNRDGHIVAANAKVREVLRAPAEL
jgi:type II secretory pathway component PulJ